MKPIFEQYLGELKEIVSFKPLIDFLRQNIIMIDGKYEQFYDIVGVAEISFEYEEFKSHLQQDSLQGECGK